MNIIRSYRAEWILLARPRLWLGLAVTATVLAALATWLMLRTARTDARPGTGVSATVLDGPGGAVAPVIATLGFAAVLVVATFASATGNEMSRGMTRFSFTRGPRRVALVTGRLSARLTVAGAATLVAIVAGVVTATALAPVYDITTDRWWTGDGFATAAGDLGLTAVFLIAYAAIGTAVATLIRSTPISLGVLLLWFGPIENVLGEGQQWARRWFPGLVIRDLMQSDAPGATATGPALLTIGAYVGVCLVVVALVTARRDVTD